MPRTSRQPSGSGYYHIVTRGNNRRSVFHIAGDYHAYLDIAIGYKKRWLWKLHHFCLMPNHVHLIIYMAEFHNLPKLMQGLNQGYERYYRRRYAHSGHLWQGRYKSIAIEKEDYLLECARYVERNPVRAGIVSDPAQYPWSSYGVYAQGQKSCLVEPNPCYLNLGPMSALRQEAYRAYLSVTRPYEQILDSSLKIRDIPEGNSSELSQKV